MERNRNAVKKNLDVNKPSLHKPEARLQRVFVVMYRYLGGNIDGVAF